MNDNKEILEREINLIQSCINRMAQNSFMVKGWTITLIAVVLALLPEKVDLVFLCLIGVVATVCFWYLDAFFLRTERLYRWKYEWVINKRLETAEYSYDLNPNNRDMWLPNENGHRKNPPKIIRVMFTKTLTPIYVPLFILCVLYLVVKIT